MGRIFLSGNYNIHNSQWSILCCEQYYIFEKRWSCF